KLTFSHPDTETFVLLRLALDAIGKGGALPAVLNAANEVAVAAFLERKLSFVGIFDLVTQTVERLEAAKNTSDIDDILACDREARAIANEILKQGI
ncbi:MAG: 1-deoxy-D-xylulose-5-phosphate reductoisomerase, partial [Clostridia bacterium]|nr:1-deoxy-D-xylulose-5-phosphate reductoisomerase [Clostridia bacterium]